MNGINKASWGVSFSMSLLICVSYEIFLEKTLEKECAKIWNCINQSIKSYIYSSPCKYHKKCVCQPFCQLDPTSLISTLVAISKQRKKSDIKNLHRVLRNAYKHPKNGFFRAILTVFQSILDTHSGNSRIHLESRACLQRVWNSSRHNPPSFRFLSRRLGNFFHQVNTPFRACITQILSRMYADSSWLVWIRLISLIFFRLREYIIRLFHSFAVCGNMPNIPDIFSVQKCHQWCHFYFFAFSSNSSRYLSQSDINNLSCTIRYFSNSVSA